MSTEYSKRRCTCINSLGLKRLFYVLIINMSVHVDQKDRSLFFIYLQNLTSYLFLFNYIKHERDIFNVT